MFEEMHKRRKEEAQKIKYHKELGWKEFDDDGDSVTVAITVIDTDFGYCVFRNSPTITMMNWFQNLDEAVEWGVDRARKEISDHEIKQAERQPKEATTTETTTETTTKKK